MVLLLECRNIFIRIEEEVVRKVVSTPAPLCGCNAVETEVIVHYNIGGGGILLCADISGDGENWSKAGEEEVWDTVLFIKTLTSGSRVIRFRAEISGTTEGAALFDLIVRSAQP